MAFVYRHLGLARLHDELKGRSVEAEPHDIVFGQPNRGILNAAIVDVRSIGRVQVLDDEAVVVLDVFDHCVLEIDRVVL